MKTHALAGALVALGVVTAGCSALGDDGGSSSGEERAGEVILVTHDSFELPDSLVERFREEHGMELIVRKSGDAGALSAKLGLTKESPTGDAAFGIDNTFASRVLDEGVFAPSDPTLPPGAEAYALAEGGDRLFPVDVGHVCVNVDDTWFAEEGVRPPRTLEDLAEPAYEDLLVVPAASTSSVGMAFLLTTVAAFGDDWRDYWQSLLDNGLKVVDGWSDAYYTDFTQGGGGGSRPIVLSYDSSPAFTVPKGEDEPTTSALLETCFRQVEYAGVLDGAANPEGAEAVLQFLLEQPVQEALPESMYVFPVDSSVELPEAWARHAVQPDEPWSVEPAEIAANREQWLREWTEITTR
ncbi:thiamine ABC transporter substrate-binding protein [Nocardioides solisilvae]|uniref:thiamine ABC transporter substrate-binding protein n=1 Tax=Nocardioides solisilvae TaxID=1542435 RepID=UPI000D74D895|nr:thiamine ABC transporter substrate-binding protein [Nocardioides solisilvae]